MMMPVYDANFIYSNIKMFRHEREHPGVRHIALGFFLHGNFKMIFIYFMKFFFTGTGKNLNVKIVQFILTDFFLG